MNPKAITYYGIDPGTTGAIARNRGGIRCVYRLYKSEKKSMSRKEVLRVWRHANSKETIHAIVACELVNSFKSDKAFSIGRFMRATGFIEGCVMSSGLDIIYVSSSAWQLEFGLGGLPTRAARLNKAITVIQDLFGVTVTQDEAAAYLICEYIRRKHTGELTHGIDKRKASSLKPATGITKRVTRELSDFLSDI